MHFTESDDEQILYNTVSGTYGSFLEVADDQFVNVGRISSSTQTMSLKVQEIPASAISVYAEFVTLEDFAFLEVADDQFVNVGRISSSTQTMSLKVQEIPASAISVYAEFVTLEDFAEFAQGGELPASIVYEDVIVQKLE